MIAKFYKMGAGAGRGKQRLVAFDNALLDGGVGNYNLIRLSSILPCSAIRKDGIGLPLGSLLPIAYATYSTDKPNTIISAAVAIGFPKQFDDQHCGVIMEYEGECNSEDALRTVQGMVEEAFNARGWDLYDIQSNAVEAVAGPGEHVSVFAYVAEWSEDHD